MDDSAGLNGWGKEGWRREGSRVGKGWNLTITVFESQARSDSSTLGQNAVEQGSEAPGRAYTTNFILVATGSLIYRMNEAIVFIAWTS